MKELMDWRTVPKLKKWVATGGGLLSVVALLVSLLSSWTVVKVFRYIGTAQKTLPVVRKAAQLYLDLNSPKREKSVRYPAK